MAGPDAKGLSGPVPLRRFGAEADPSVHRHTHRHTIEMELVWPEGSVGNNPSPSMPAASSPIIWSIRLSAPLLAQIESPQLKPMDQWQRREGLWLGTCFEIFAGRADGSYTELNWSPCGDWCVFSFGSYRKRSEQSGGEGLTDPTSSPVLSAVYVTDGQWRVELSAESLGLAPPTRSAGIAKVGLTAVARDRDSGELSYWSLQHSGVKPDFHWSNDWTYTLRA